MLTAPKSPPLKGYRNAAHQRRRLALLKSSEGCVLYAYDDENDKRIEPGDEVEGTLTIGWGHTGADVHPGQTITQAEADSILAADLHPFEVAVNNLVTHNINSNQFSALVDFAYNEGSGALARSSLLAALNAGDVAAAADDFGKYIYANGHVDQGLITRRAHERALFLTPC